jgi:hypothetical protein
MRITCIAFFASTAFFTVGGVLPGQQNSDSENAKQASNRRGVLSFVAIPSKAEEPVPSATILRATTETGVSKAEIFRQPEPGNEDAVRVASLPDSARGSAKLTRGTSRSVTPAAPNMDRKPFLVGFRRPTKQAQSFASQQVIAVEPTTVVESEPIVPAPDDEIQSETFDAAAPTAPATPDVSAADAQVDDGSGEPSLCAVSSNANKGEENYCNRDCRNRCWCNLGCEKKLFPKQCGGLEIGGWLSQGYHNRNNILVNNRRREWNLHQAWLYAGKAASQDSCDWDFGYRADLLYGIDAQDLQAFGNGPTGAPSGWDNDWDFGSFGWALPQLYVEFANLDWNVKVGKFFSPYGYEVIGATGNFFYSHSFTMYNSEPFTMSGVLAEKRVSSNKSYVFGVTAGWDTAFENNEGGGNVIFGTREQLNDHISLAITNSWGDAGTRGSGNLTSAVAEVELTDSLDYVLQTDFLNLGTNQEFGIVQYLFKEINPCLSVGSRLEWWKSDQFFTSSRSTYGYTVGANYRRNANVTIRPELRFDWGAAAVDPGAPIIGFDVVRTF